MQTALNDSEQWANDVGLQFSPAKTKALIFSRKRTKTNLPEPLQMSGVEVELVEEFKYLGIIMDSLLSWTPHINYIAKKAKRHLMMLHRGLGTTWGPTTAITLWLYTGIVQPAMTYGCTVWAGQANKAMAMFKLIKVQRLALILVAPMRQLTPTAGLEMILGVPPMELYIKFLATTTYNRLNLKPHLWSGNHGDQKGHITWLKERALTLPHTALINRCVCHELNRRYAINIAEGKDVPHNLGSILCYTDGSGRLEGSGSRCAVYSGASPDPIHENFKFT
jgi:hypothetical protein